MADGIRLPSTPKMAMAKPYSNYQDIINGIAAGKVNSQNYEELLKALGIKDPTEYALTKRHIEDAIKYYSRNLNAQQANAMYSSIANTPTLGGLRNLIEDINNTQASNRQENPSAARQIQDAIQSTPADVEFEVPPQVVESPEETVNPVSQGSNSSNALPIPDVNIGAATVPVTALSEPSRREFYNTGKILGNSLRNIADNIPDVLRDFQSTQSTPAPVNPRREAANHLYNIFNQPDTFEVVTDEPVELPQTKKPAKTPQKQKALQNLTKEINTARTPVQIARPSYTNDAYSSQIQPAPVQPAEPPLDDSYYRYLRNNGWNDFDARRQAIRYY